MYSNCQDWSSLPIVTFELGVGPSAIKIPLFPQDYLARIGDRCVLILEDLTCFDTHRVIGMNLLRKILTVFDQRNGRLGFCS